MEKIDEQTARNQMSALHDYTGADAELGEPQFAGFDDDSAD
jgi:hypothetical protein